MDVGWISARPVSVCKCDSSSDVKKQADAIQREIDSLQHDKKMCPDMKRQKLVQLRGQLQQAETAKNQRKADESRDSTRSTELPAQAVAAAQPANLTSTAGTEQYQSTRTVWGSVSVVA